MNRPRLRLKDEDLRRMLAVACATSVMSFIAAAVFGTTLLATRDDVQHNTDNAKVAKKVATKADAKANTAGRKANRNAKTVRRLGTKIVQQRVLLRQTRTVLKQVGILGHTGARGPRGLPGVGLEPTSAALDAAVDRCQAAGKCSRPPTAEQVYAAIQACAQAGGCRGPAGADGKDGTNGRDAPPVTDQQLDASTARYCDAHGGCAGPMGLNGRDGAVGPPGAPAQPFTFSWDDLNGRTHVCTVDPQLGADVVQPCAS